MGEKKIGRPTDNPKETMIKFRADKTTCENLRECSQTLRVSQAEVLRRGVKKMYDGLKK